MQNINYKCSFIKIQLYISNANLFAFLAYFKTVVTVADCVVPNLPPTKKCQASGHILSRALNRKFLDSNGSGPFLVRNSCFSVSCLSLKGCGLLWPAIFDFSEFQNIVT